MSTVGMKHMVRCRCVMPQFKRLPEPPVHQFVVFSIVEDDKVLPKFVQCNNCGIIHKIVDMCKSEIIKTRESMGSLMTLEDVQAGMHKDLSTILQSNGADLPSWEAARFIYDNKRWGEIVVLNTDAEEGTRQGKYLQIIGENLFKVNSFSREEIAKEH